MPHSTFRSTGRAFDYHSLDSYLHRNLSLCLRRHNLKHKILDLSDAQQEPAASVLQIHITCCHVASQKKNTGWCYFLLFICGLLPDKRLKTELERTYLQHVSLFYIQNDRFSHVLWQDKETWCLTRDAGVSGGAGGTTGGFIVVAGEARDAATAKCPVTKLAVWNKSSACALSVRGVNRRVLMVRCR